MSDLFNEDFRDFIDALNKNEVRYLLVGGYAVILHGYIRSTADMDIWVDKTRENLERLNTALYEFGSPAIPEVEFLSSELDVWGIGREPNRIEILSEVKGLLFEVAFEESEIYKQGNVQIRFIDFYHLLKAKTAAGRYKDKNDIEQLTKNKKI